MKMTDPWVGEAPSGVGSFLIWQQPHLIYLAELLYRANPTPALLQKYARLVDETAEFMGDFADYDKQNDRYILRGCIAAQETLPAATTINPPFELSQWHCALQIAQTRRERLGERSAMHIGMMSFRRYLHWHPRTVCISQQRPSLILIRMKRCTAITQQ